MKKKRSFPHTWVIIFALIILSAIATWFVPGGRYVEVIANGEKTLVYEQTAGNPQTWEVFAALFRGFEKQSGIIIFILMIGGAFWIMNSSRAIDAGIMSFLRLTRRLSKYRLLRKIGIDNLIISLIMLLFSVFGAVFGMSEETIAFIIILVPLAISMGYDSIMGVCMVYVAAGLGFAGAVLNPFTVGIAQGLAEVPLFSGFEYRIFCWIVLNIVGIVWVLRYARKLRKNPRSSPVYEEDEYWRKGGESGESTIEFVRTRGSWLAYGLSLTALLAFSLVHPYTTLCIGDPADAASLRFTFPFIPVTAVLFALSSIPLLRKSYHFFVLNLLALTVIMLIIGVMGYQWYIMEIATLFFAMGILAGISMNNSPNRITKLFIEGTGDILPAALVVGLAGGIIVVLEDGKIIATLLHRMAGLMDGSGQMASVSFMYLIQTVINVVIPSGSAKAALTMPIMAPFSDLIGLSRQATIMAFQFGDGFTNMITPTSGVLIGVLGVARIPFNKWVRWVLPFLIILIITGFLLLIPTVYMDLPGF